MASPLGVGSADFAVKATLDGDGFLAWSHGGPAAKVLDITMWHYEEGNEVNFVGHVENRPESFMPGGGRSWTLNDDGTLSAMHAPHLVVGMEMPDCTLVDASDSQKRLVLEDRVAKALRGGGDAALTLKSHPGCAICPKSKESQRIDQIGISFQQLTVGGAADAMTVRLEPPFLISTLPASRDYVADVPFGSFSVHCEGPHGKLPIAVIKEEHGNAKNGSNAARLFQLNADNTISPVSAPHLVFGLRGELCAVASPAKPKGGCWVVS